MTHQPKILIVTDPRTFDGTAYAVADRAVAQVTGLVKLTLDVMPETRKMVLNADLSRQMDLGDEPDAKASVLNRQLKIIEQELASIRRKLETIHRAAGYDPKHPPR